MKGTREWTKRAGERAARPGQGADDSDPVLPGVPEARDQAQPVRVGLPAAVVGWGIIAGEPRVKEEGLVNATDLLEELEFINSIRVSKIEEGASVHVGSDGLMSVRG